MFDKPVKLIASDLRIEVMVSIVPADLFGFAGRFIELLGTFPTDEAILFRRLEEQGSVGSMGNIVNGIQIVDALWPGCDRNLGMAGHKDQGCRENQKFYISWISSREGITSLRSQ